MRVVKLSEYAEMCGVTYRTVWNRFKDGKIKNAYKDEFGNIFVKVESDNPEHNKVAIYARVSSNENKVNLDSQAERLKQYAIAKGYTIVEVVKEVGSGVNDNRAKLLKLLEKDSYGTIIVEHKDRLTRFGFNYIEALLKKQNKQIEVVNKAEDEMSDLMQDLISVIYLFNLKMYGPKQAKSKTEKIIKCLEDNND